MNGKNKFIDIIQVKKYHKEENKRKGRTYNIQLLLSQIITSILNRASLRAS